MTTPSMFAGCPALGATWDTCDETATGRHECTVEGGPHTLHVCRCAQQFYAVGLARRTDPDTSHEAAARVRGLREKHEWILTKLTHANLTPLELEALYNDQYRSAATTIRKRCTELKQRGFVEPTGAKRDGSQVLRLSQKGKECHDVAHTRRTA